MKTIAIVDYGVGNLKSVSNALAYLGLNPLVTGDAGEIEGADALILPGVGAFPAGADKLRETGLDRAVIRQAGPDFRARAQLSKVSKDRGRAV